MASRGYTSPARSGRLNQAAGLAKLPVLSSDCTGYSHVVVDVQRPYAIEGPAELQAKIV